MAVTIRMHNRIKSTESEQVAPFPCLFSLFYALGVITHRLFACWSSRLSRLRRLSFSGWLCLRGLISLGLVIPPLAGSCLGRILLYYFFDIASR